MKYIPVDGTVLVLPDGAEEKLKSGLIIPQTVKQEIQEGVILEVGNSNGHFKMVVSKGDKIVYTSKLGVEIEVDGKVCLAMRQCDIIGVLD